MIENPIPWRVIRAAPDMLEALEEALLQIEYRHQKFQATGTGEATMVRIRAAIAKAKGETDAKEAKRDGT
jgi:hypothetical protein